MRTQVYGRPGAYASKLAKDALMRVGGFFLLGIFSLYLIHVFGGVGAFSAGGLRPVLAVLLTLVTLALFAYSYEAWDRFKKASIGARSEIRVGKELERIGAIAVVHGALLGAGGDADHVVLGPVAVVVETKTGFGNVRIEGEKIIANQRTIPGSPLRQAQRQAVALKKRANCWTSVVVCIPDMKNPPLETNIGWVCSLGDLKGVILNLKRPLPAALALELAKSISSE